MKNNLYLNTLCIKRKRVILLTLLLVLVLISCIKPEYDPITVDYESSYTIAIIPDIQIYTCEKNNPILDSMSRFINESDYIHYSLFTGDLTNNNYAEQWGNALTFYNSLDSNKGISFCLGNHDYGTSGQMQDRTTLCYSNFLSSLPRGAVESYLESIDNTLSFFDIDSIPFGVLSLEFGPRDAVLSWADSIISCYPETYFFILTHAFLDQNGNIYDCDTINPTEDSPKFYPFARNESVNDGQDILDKIVYKNKNVRFIVCGHSGPSNGFYCRTEKNSYDNTIFEILVNFQFFPNGGNGYIGLLSFFPDRHFNFTIYSPYLKEHKREANYSFLLD